ncbi:hypothetical protein OKW24_004046 [Peribacillus simplex]|uniref:hypothetical protein n=1 Tax=Peribacillus simplex TaxID=1478 RepID=UPI0035C6D464|nr:hypothetical protein [Peribacillus simplex]
MPKSRSLQQKLQTSQLQNVDEVAKVIDGFLNQVAKALGIPVSLLHGDMADVEKPTRNYMTFCIDPFLKKIKDELNAKMIDKKAQSGFSSNYNTNIHSTIKEGKYVLHHFITRGLD